MQTRPDARGNQPAVAWPDPPPSGPFLYRLAEHLGNLTRIPRHEQCQLWRRVLDLYADQNRAPHRFLRRLIEEPLLEEILEDEVFWGLVGSRVSRVCYAQAPEYLTAFLATAALVAAREDRLPLTPEELALLEGPSPEVADAPP